jgi:predicted nucleic acid-binding protein
LLAVEGVELVVPALVLQEISALGPADPAVIAMRGAGCTIVTPSLPIPESLKGWKLDPGEESVLAVALQQTSGCEVVIDDLAGRRCAKAHGIPLLGTIGLVILAKRLGRIVEARPIIEDLRRAGLYIRDDVIADALKRAGE